MPVNVLAHVSNFIGHEERRNRIMIASMNGRDTVSEGTREHMNSVQGNRMQLHQDALAKPERLFFLFDEGSNDFKSEFGLANAVFSFSPRLFVGVAYKI